MLKSFNFFTSKEDKEVKNEAARIVRAGYKPPSPCPCCSAECTDWRAKLMTEIATITKKMEASPVALNNPTTSTIIGVSGMGHLSAESYVKPERKDESNINNFIRPNGGAGVASSTTD